VLLKIMLSCDTCCIYLSLCVLAACVLANKGVHKPDPNQGGADVWGGQIVGGRVAVACRTSCLQSSSPRATPGTITHEAQSAVSRVHMPTTKCVQEIVNIRRSGAGGQAPGHGGVPDSPPGQVADVRPAR